MRGPFSKPVELKVAALLEMCQAGLVFKTVERLYKISVPAMQRFFHEFMQLQVQHEYAKHVYYPPDPECTSAVTSCSSAPCESAAAEDWAVAEGWRAEVASLRL